MGRRALILCCALLPWVAWAQGGTVEGRIHLEQALSDGGTAALKKASEVVVYIPDFRRPAPARPTPVIQQKHKRFVPDVLPIVVGEGVTFENEDGILHNVFSTSPAAPGGGFDLGSFRGPESKTIHHFDQTGIIDLYCDIHPEMVGTILVLPNPVYAVTGPDGRFTLHDVPPGTHVLYAWARHAEPASVQITVSPGKTTRVKLTVRRMAGTPKHLDKYGRPYSTHPQMYDTP